MAWYDSLISGLEKGGKVWDAASPFINLGASYYNKNQQQNALGNAFNDYSGYVNQGLQGYQDFMNQGLQSYQGFVDQGLQKYGDYTRDAMGTYGNHYEDALQAIYGVQGAIGSAYSNSMAAQAPYARAGKQATAGYQNLLNDPNKIKDDPGYQFRFDQGAEALRRNAAATGFRGSGNQMLALSEYGQNYATAELDKALARYSPLINAGLQAAGNTVNAGNAYSSGMASTGNSIANLNMGYGETAARMQQGLGAAHASAYQGIGQAHANAFNGLGQAYAGAYEGLGEAAAGRHLGESGATSAFTRDLGRSNPLSAAADAVKGGKAAYDMVTGASGPLTSAAVNGMAGAGAAQGASALGAAGTGAISANAALGTLSSTPLSAGITGNGMAAMAPGGQGMAAMFPGTSGTLATGTAGTGTAAGVTSAQATTTGWGAAASGLLQSAGIAGLMIGGMKLLSGLNGGAADKTKTPKLFKEFERDPASGYQWMDNILTGKMWTGEDNTNVKYAINPAFEKGIIDINYPTLHSADSKVDIWNSPPENLSPVALAQSFGLDSTKGMEYQKLLQAKKDEMSGAYDTAGATYPEKIEAADRAIRLFESTYFSPQSKQQTAQQVITNLRQNGYQGDLSKIENYLGTMYGGNVTSPGNMFNAFTLP